MEHTIMQYEVRYLVNGQEQVMNLEATSAAAASETTRSQVCGENDDFELIQVQLVEDELVDDEDDTEDA